MNRFHKIRAVHIRHEQKFQIAFCIMLQRLASHHRTEVRTADADVDDVRDALAGKTFPRAAADALGKCRQLVQNRVDIRHDIFSVHENFRVARRAQRGVQHRAIFREINFVAAKHRVHASAQIRLFRQLQQQF